MTMDEVFSDFQWVESLIATNPRLAATNYTVMEHDGIVSVQVVGAHWEAHVWRSAINGRIRPSYIVAGVRRQLVVGRIQVEVIQDPRSAS
jgi:hypothetical protein